MVDLFELEAIRNNVYPIDDRTYERFNAALAGRPDLMGDRTTLTLAEGMVGIMENAFLNVKNRSKTITANLELAGQDAASWLAQGRQVRRLGAVSERRQAGVRVQLVRAGDLRGRVPGGPGQGLRGGEAGLRLRRRGTGKGGVAILYVDGEKVAEGRIDKTQPAVFSGGRDCRCRRRRSDAGGRRLPRRS